MGQRTSVYLDDDLHAAAKASGISLAKLIRRGLGAGAEHRPSPGADQRGSAPAPLAGPPDGEPSPGVACSAPGCWNRDTARYGLHRLALCTACAAALQGRIYQRELPHGAERLIRRGAA